MLFLLMASEFDPVAWFKTAAVVVVGATFLAIVVRVLGSQASAMQKGASMPLDDLDPLSDDSAQETNSRPSN